MAQQPYSHHFEKRLATPGLAYNPSILPYHITYCTNHIKKKFLIRSNAAHNDFHLGQKFVENGQLSSLLVNSLSLRKIYSREDKYRIRLIFRSITFSSSPEHFNLWQTLYQTTWRHLSFDKSAQVSVSLTGKLSLSTGGTSCIALFPASSNRFEFSWLAPKRFKILETEFDTCDDAEWTTTALGMLADTAVGFAECWRCNSRANRRRSLFSGSCRMAFRSSRRFRWALLRRYRPIGSSLSIFSSVLPEYNALPEASPPRGAMPWCRSMRGSP